MRISKLVWIVLALVLGVLCAGCAHSQKVKLVSDITPNGEVTYHAEFIAEF